MTSKKHRLIDRQYVVPFMLITTLFFLWGFARAILDVLNKHFQDELHISITQSSLIQVTTYLGYFLMAIPAGLFINRFGYRRGVVFGLVLFGVGALSFVPGMQVGTFNVFLASLFVIGCGLVFLETAANPYVTELGPEATASSRLNLSQTFNGMGCFMATFIVGQYLFRTDGSSGDVTVPYMVMGIVVLAVAVVFSFVRLPEITAVSSQEQEDITEGGASRLSKLFRHRLFVFGLIALLAYEVAEISINSYFVNFMTGEGLMSKNTASVVISLALVIFMVGRFVCSWIMRSVRAERMLLYCALGTILCMALVMLDLGKVSMVALVLNYLFEAMMFPTIFSLSLRGLGNLTKSASSLLMMTPVGGCGFMLMGWLADSTGSMTLPFVIPLVGYAVVAAFAYQLVRKI
ncbi:MAG: sugar MFS transporter [Prevotella sp.]|nr:sugar MFS transporter [Prevotella sp.]